MPSRKFQRRRQRRNAAGMLTRSKAGPEYTETWTPRLKVESVELSVRLPDAVQTVERRFDDVSQAVSIGEVHTMSQSILEELQEIRSLLRQHLDHHEHDVSTVEMRSISDTEAREEILALFAAKTNTDLYYEDICTELRLPLEQVFKICCNLEDEGMIGDSRRTA